VGGLGDGWAKLFQKNISNIPRRRWVVWGNPSYNSEVGGLGDDWAKFYEKKNLTYLEGDGWCGGNLLRTVRWVGLRMAGQTFLKNKI
jgi:hypothetical protein